MMESLLLYLFRSALLMAVFFFCYRLLLSRETFHRFNRVMLITIALFSFILPLIHLTRYVDKPLPVVNANNVADTGHNMPPEILSLRATLPELLKRDRDEFLNLYSHYESPFVVWTMSRIICKGRYADRSEGVDVIESDQIPGLLNWMRLIVMTSAENLGRKARLQNVCLYLSCPDG